jgi:hypothetical protein
MMAIGFLGYVYSPKWFNESIFYAIFLIITYYVIINLIKKSKAGNSIKNKKYDKLKNK